MLHRHLNREARRAIVILDLEQGSRVRKGGTDMSSLTPRAGLVTVLMVSWFAAACGPSLPTNVNVDILQPHPREISLADIQAAFTGNDLLPPLYEQSPGTTLYAIVIPFDFASLPEGVAYNRVAVMMNLLKDWRRISPPQRVEPASSFARRESAPMNRPALENQPTRGASTVRAETAPRRSSKGKAGPGSHFRFGAISSWPSISIWP